MQQQGAGAGAYEAEFGGGGGKATRRKGRDMERALARGDLGALGDEVRTKKISCLLDRSVLSLRRSTHMYYRRLARLKKR